VVVVDNASTDDSLRRIRNAYPHVAILQTAANLGYSGGNNVGILYALREGADHVLILNSDVTLDPDAVARSVEVTQMLGDKAGVVGFATYHFDRPDVLHCLGLNGGLPGGNFYTPSPEEMARSAFLPIGSGYGCAMLLTRRLIETVGLLDENFFLMHEELDLCARAAAAGLAVVGATQARVWHKGSVSFGGEESPLRLYYLFRNWPLYAKKRFAEQEKLELFSEYMKQYRMMIAEKAMEYLRERRLTHAFAVLAAGRCAEAGRWGKKRLSIGLRVRVGADIVKLLGRAAGRRVGRLLLSSQ
jgi:GT2 family glycosyltransferase